MNSQHLQNQLNDVQSRVRDASIRAANASLTVDEKLSVQKDLDDLASLHKRLQAQLSEARQRENAIQKEREQLALDTELDEIRMSYQSNRSEFAGIVNELTQEIVETVPGLDELNIQRDQIANRYEAAFRQRYGRELGFQNRLQAQGLEHAEFSDRVAELLAGISNELASRRMAEQRRNGV